MTTVHAPSTVELKMNTLGKPRHKSMDRDDLFDNEARPTVDAINALIRDIYDAGLAMTSWYGSVEAPQTGVGLDNRGPNYEPLPGQADDNRLPWFLYWEIEWVMRNGPRLEPGMRVLDIGGTGSLFSCYLASRGVEVHTIDINPDLLKLSDKLAKKMGWNMKSYAMDAQALKFEDEFFDHAYSICVFEHLDFYIKRRTFCETHRTLKDHGVLSITFDYDNPAPYVFDYGDFDPRPRNQIHNPDRVREIFHDNGLMEMVGGPHFHDNGKRYLSPPQAAKLARPRDYSFGAVFLQKRSYW